MQFAGLAKLTLLDFPGHTACTLFTQGCDFRCPFCQNKSLLPQTSPENPITEEAVLSFLQRRHGILDGVCITGGEPLLQAGLADFIRRVRDLGFLVKLDTNGNHPGLLRALMLEGLVDMVAMDIKNSPEHYAKTVGIPDFDVTPILASAESLMVGSIPFEFRTTVTHELHTEADFVRIGEWLRGDAPYYLQFYQDSSDVLHRGLTPPGDEEMNRYRQLLLPYLPHASLRGR